MKRKTLLKNHLTGIRNLIIKKIGKLPIATDTGFELIEIDKIIYCEAHASYTYFYLEDGSNVMSSKNIGEYERELVPFNFLRIHKSYLINLLHVNKYSKEDGGYVHMNLGANQFSGTSQFSRVNQLSLSKRKKITFLNCFFAR
jgi:two-component system LytT family response regulator